MNCDSSVSLSKLQLTKAPEAPRGPAGVSSAEVHGEQVGQLGSSPQTGSGVGPGSTLSPVTFHSLGLSHMCRAHSRSIGHNSGGSAQKMPPK